MQHRLKLPLSLPTALACLALGTLLSGCATTPRERWDTAAYHTVLVWLKDPESPTASQQIIDATAAMAELPGVLYAAAGPPIPSNRPIVDDSYDVGVFILFDSQESLEAFDSEPLHQQLRQDVLQPLAARIQIYDFSDAAPTGWEESARQAEMREQARERHRDHLRNLQRKQVLRSSKE